ncbi:MAG: prolyl oligopeptidase family serine peptidase [Bacteroidetes bacterium]|nr:prolyl oligopeptidase family serine peptidase [Bacteroidota bacterium]
MKKAQQYFFIAIVLLCPVFGFAQQTAEKYVRETGYLLSFPNGYNADTLKKWPLLLFLHGSGESGHDLEKVKLHGPPQLLAENKNLPFITISPQSDVPYGWDIEMLYGLLQDAKKRYRVDENRIYLSGLSMGGFGTISLAQKYPDEFAAIAPVCGGGDTSGAWKLRHIAAWFFHGAKDDVVPPAGSINLVNAIKPYNKDVRLTIYPEANHNSWDSTYNKPLLYDWLLRQSKYRFVEKPVAAESLQKLSGYYVGPDKDTLQIKFNGKELVAYPPNQEIPLKSAGDGVFFIAPDKSVELRFEMNRGAVTGFLILGNDKMYYRRIK